MPLDEIIFPAKFEPPNRSLTPPKWRKVILPNSAIRKILKSCYEKYFNFFELGRKKVQYFFYCRNRCPSMRSLGNPRDDFADSVSNPLKIEYCEFEVHLYCTASETPNQDVKLTFFE